MARANVVTILPLDRFAFRAGINPIHFNQVFVREFDEFKTCDVPVLQTNWQHAGRTGRDEVAEAITSAESMLTNELGFSPAPVWERDDSVTAIRPFNVNLYNFNGLNIRGTPIMYKLRRGYIQTGGIETFALIDDAAPVAYVDLNGDTYEETAIITFITDVTDLSEIALYYPGHGTDGRWQIQPFISAVRDDFTGVCTVRVYRHQLVIENLLETLGPVGVDGLDDASFLTEVMVYRRYNNPATQVNLRWDGRGCCECTACNYSLQAGCLGIENPRLSIVTASPGNWNVDTNNYDFAYFTACRAPDKIIAYYKAGWPLVDGNMDPIWELAITRLALGMLQRPLCNCEPLENALKYWAQDLAYIKSTPLESSSHRVPQRMLENPLGTTRGAVWAWQQVVKHRLGEAVVNV